MEEIRWLTAETEDIGSRIDVFIAEELDELTRSAVQKLIAEGNVWVNDAHVKANYKLKGGESIRLLLPQAEETEILPEDIPLDILYEDDSVIVVNKPQGMVVHPAAGHSSGTLVNALLFHCKDSLSGINGQLRPGIVHRIDKDTSGVLMAAKNDKAHHFLAEQLAEHSITRKYIAIAMNGFREDSGTVDAPIGRDPKDRKRMTVTQRNGRHAVTHYRVLERFGQLSLIEVQLETGRTHQIRVHMSHIGHPLLGDPVYGSKKQPYRLQGQALHAAKLGFIHPDSKEYMEFTAPLPPYFEELLQRLRAKKGGSEL